MEDVHSRGKPLQLTVILVAAVLQGWALYGLYFAAMHDYWPATDRGWLIGLYVFWIFVPLTVQLMADHARQRALWVLTGMVALTFFYFGWHFGGAVLAEPPRAFGGAATPFALGCAMAVLWLMTLPFLQGRLVNRAWRTPYREYFGTAWRNKLMLAEAALFTATLWLLLFLWAGLFDLLGIEFFEDLFTDPLFAYPVTAVAFGIALHLVGSLDRLVTLVLEQLLGLLKWLAVVAGLILALFTVALLLQLPDLLGAGRRVIGAAWLLWLLAVMVLLLNAAYRDGSVARPYPPAIALALRVIAPLMVIVALTALYSLGLRIAGFGLSVTRVWGLIVALAALAYSIGYSYAALRSGHWMAAMGWVNVAVALGLIAVIALTLTPLLSPYRLSAASQYRQAQSAEADGARDALRYLRFSSGRYGIEFLERLAVIADHPRAEQLRKMAASALAMEYPWQDAMVDEAEVLAGLELFPAGSGIDAALRRSLTSQALLSAPVLEECSPDGRRCAGLYIDLDTDGRDEFVLLMPHRSVVYGNSTSGWIQSAGGHVAFAPAAEWDELVAALQGGDFSAEAPSWQNLRIGNTVFEMNPIPEVPPAAIEATAVVPAEASERASPPAAVVE